METDKYILGGKGTKPVNVQPVSTLPQYCYWLLPFVVLSSPAGGLIGLFSGSDNFPPVWLIVLLVAESVVVGVPIIVALTKLWYRWANEELKKSFSPETFIAFFASVVRIFKLNPDLSARHPWFKYCYYGSFVLCPAATLLGISIYVLLIFWEFV